MLTGIGHVLLLDVCVANHEMTMVEFAQGDVQVADTFLLLSNRLRLRSACGSLVLSQPQSFYSCLALPILEQNCK